MSGKLSIDALKSLMSGSTVGSNERIRKNNNDMDLLNIMPSIQKLKEQEAELLNEAQAQGYNPNLTIENSQVNNKYYQGDPYYVQYDGLNVTVENKRTNEKHSFSFFNLLANVSDEEKVEFMKYIQTLPGEVLEDISIELDGLEGVLGKDMHTRGDNPNFVAGGYYTNKDDTIVTSPIHLVHELGHAIDYHGEAGNNISLITRDSEIVSTFEEELEAFKAAGNKQYDYKDDSTRMPQNYATANVREMFAESYTLMMTGKCKSGNTILKYFPKTFALIQDRLSKYRQEDELARHSTEFRETVRSIKEYLA